MHARLAGFELQEVEKLILVLKHQVVQLEHDLGSLRNREARPIGLSVARAIDLDGHLLSTQLRQVVDAFGRCRVDYRIGLVGGGEVRDQARDAGVGHRLSLRLRLARSSLS